MQEVGSGVGGGGEDVEADRIGNVGSEHADLDLADDVVPLPLVEGDIFPIVAEENPAGSSVRGNGFFSSAE